MLSYNIKDVAKAAGVSVATVSRVVNKNAVVSPKTTAIVEETIKQLKFSPNSMGRNLRKSETNVILVISPSTKQIFFGDTILGMQETAQKLGYDIIMCVSDSNAENEMRLLHMLYNKSVDAAVLIATRLGAEELTQLNRDFHIALCSNRVENVDILSVSVDDEGGAYMAVSSLIERGHTKIGMISSKMRVFSSIDRERGYRRALEEKGIEINDEYILQTEYDYRSGSDAFRYFMDLKEPPTAIFAISDFLAIGAVKEALRQGKKVGKAFPIIGFDNVDVSEIFSPSISTVIQAGYPIGKLIIEKLVRDIILNEKSTEDIRIPTEMIFRESTEME
ncbi:MAG: LacI family DNA-binding transcriptional regulator [Oscillospiraceae bacterium]